MFGFFFVTHEYLFVNKDMEMYIVRGVSLIGKTPHNHECKYIGVQYNIGFGKVIVI